jgi:hypothetical protein
MSRQRFAEKMVNRHGLFQYCSGYVPLGLEYFTGTYLNRPVEFSLFRDETPETVNIVYLDSGETNSLEIDVIDFNSIENINPS